MSPIEAAGIFLGIVSIGFNLFQLYRERELKRENARESSVQASVLASLAKGLAEAQQQVVTLAQSGKDASIITPTIVAALGSQRIYIDEMLHRMHVQESSPSGEIPLLGLPPRADGAESIDLITGVDQMTLAMLEATERAKQYVFVVGGRSRNDIYLNALAERVKRGDVRYVRVLTGDHIRHPLCTHLEINWDQIDLGYLEEDKYGGILATDDTVIIALQSSRIPALDKGLRIRGARLAADYRQYVLELLGTSKTDVSMEFIKQRLCKTCRPALPSTPASSAHSAPA